MVKRPRSLCATSQKLTDDFTKKVDDVIGKKEKELMAV